MSGTENSEAPKMRFAAVWVSVFLLAALWMSGAVILLLRLGRPRWALIAGEVGWLILLLPLVLQAIGWTRIELTPHGVVKRGGGKTQMIPWSEASLQRRGYHIVVVTPTNRIVLNPMAYANRGSLISYLMERVQASRGPDHTSGDARRGE